MNKYELIDLLSSSDEEDVYIEAEDVLLDDFSVEHVEDQFDGFDTVYPSCIKLVAKKNNSGHES